MSRNIGIWQVFFAILVVYLGLASINRLLFNVQDAAGWLCDEDGAAKGLARGETAPAGDAGQFRGTPLAALRTGFNNRTLCNRTRIKVEGDGAKYLITILPYEMESWKDGSIPSTLSGFDTADAPHLHQRLLLALRIPFRRHLTLPWFRLVLRVGASSAEEIILDPDPGAETIERVITPTRSGELFIYVNDAVICIWKAYDIFYHDNG